MKKLILISIFFSLFCSKIGNTKGFEHESEMKLRSLYGYTQYADSVKKGQNRNHLPVFAGIDNKLTYDFNDSLSFNFYADIKAKVSSNIENLNQGHWGEAVYAGIFSDYGDIYIGQMENVASQLSVTKADLSVWQISSTEITDFIENPNWYQSGKTKYYATLTSTNPNTDGSSFKISYLTPEYNGTTIGISYTPEVNATDSLISKFSSYSGNSSYSLALYNQHEFNSVNTEVYAAFSDYENSHQEYGVGFLVYRKGWSVFASYLRSNTSGHDKAITKTDVSENQKAYFDDFRNSVAYKLGVSYEFAFLTSTLSYFDSYSQNTKAYNRIINLHNSLKFDKNYALYLGCAYSMFNSAKEIAKNNKGFSAYAGIQFEF